MEGERIKRKERKVLHKRQGKVKEGEGTERRLPKEAHEI